MNIPEHNLTVLQKADLSKGKGLKESTHAAFTVLRALESELSPGTMIPVNMSVNFLFTVHFDL